MGQQVAKTEFGHTVTAEVMFDGRAYRWASNDRPVPMDACDQYGVTRLPGYSEAAQFAAVREHNDRAFAEYRASRAAETADIRTERIAEMRAAFGPGETVVNVITGERTQL